MNGLGYFAIGLFIGGMMGIVLMSILTLGSKADDELLGVKQYEETD